MRSSELRNSEFHNPELSLRVRWTPFLKRAPGHVLGLSRGKHLAQQDLIPCQHSVLVMVTSVALVPPLCRSITRSSRVDLRFLFTILCLRLWSGVLYTDHKLTGNPGNKWRTEELLKVIGLWELEMLLVCYWPNTYVMQEFINIYFLKSSNVISWISFPHSVSHSWSGPMVKIIDLALV